MIPLPVPAHAYAFTSLISTYREDLSSLISFSLAMRKLLLFDLCFPLYINRE
jgi:hypothetical protein